MKYEDLKLACPEAAEAAVRRFTYVDSMDFLVRSNVGCTTFLKTGECFQWYWFDPSRQEWRDHHLVKGENWIDPRNPK